MGIYHFLNLFFYLEIIVLILVFILILLKRIRSFISNRKDLYLKQTISQYVADCLEKKQIPRKRLSPHFLLEVLETYDRRISGEDWNEAKMAFSQKSLLPKARRWGKSWFWVKRNFAARVFALTPLSQDEKYILSLIDDRSFLVRSIACSAAVRLESKIGVLKTLENINREPGYGRYYYSDILSQGSNQIFLWIAEIAEANRNLHLVCLEVLAIKTAPVPTPFLQRDFQAKEGNIRSAALKVAITNPQKGSIELFSACLDDKDESIRALGGRGLGNYFQEDSLAALQKGALDSSWTVRLECAKSLKKLGKLDLLKDTEMIQYVHEFG